MNHHDIFGAEHLVDGFLLGRIEPRETDGRKGELPDGSVGIEQVAEVCQAVALGLHHPVESLEHEPVGGLVEKQLYA